MSILFSITFICASSDASFYENSSPSSIPTKAMPGPAQKTRRPGTYTAILFLLVSFLESGTGCFLAVACTAALNIHMVCIAFIIRIIHTPGRFTVNADRPGRVHGIGNALSLSLPKALAASILLFPGRLSSDHDISLTAAFLAVIDLSLIHI